MNIKFDLCDDPFAKSGGRALSSLTSKYNVNNNLIYDMFTHLFYTCISLVWLSQIQKM